MASMPCWPAVRITLIIVPWVRPPRSVRLPPHTFRFTAAGRLPVLPAISGVDPVVGEEAEHRRGFFGHMGEERRTASWPERALAQFVQALGQLDCGGGMRRA